MNKNNTITLAAWRNGGPTLGDNNTYDSANAERRSTLAGSLASSRLAVGGADINSQVFSINRITKAKVREESNELVDINKLNLIVNNLINNTKYVEVSENKVNKTLKYIESLRVVDFKSATALKLLYNISPSVVRSPSQLGGNRQAVGANHSDLVLALSRQADTVRRGGRLAATDYQPFQIATNLIKLTFLSMGALISKPKYSISYSNLSLEGKVIKPVSPLPVSANRCENAGAGNAVKKITIQLFYYIKLYRYRNYSNFMKFNHNIIDNLDFIKDTCTASNRLDAGGAETSALPVAVRRGGNLAAQADRNNLLITFNNKCEYLANFLGKLFNAEIELEFIRIDRTYFESNILAQDLAIKSLDDRFVKLALSLFKKAPTINPNKYFTIINKEIFPSRIAGLYIKVAGRAFNQKIIPKLTFKEMQKGTLINHNIRLVDKGRFTSKSRRGSYTFTVKIAHLIKYT